MLELPRLTLTPIGFARTPFRDKRSAPRQSAAARGTRGRIELVRDARYEHALSDLEGFSHLWVLFWFHASDGFRAKVEAPRSARKRGVFATRAPYRPNPLGLTAVRLERIEGHVLHILDVDMLDGTPVLDLKPYLAYSDAVPGAGSGWLSRTSHRDTRPRASGRLRSAVASVANAIGMPFLTKTPAEPIARAILTRLGPISELEDAAQAPADPGPRYTVRFSPRAREQLAWLEARTALDLRAAAEQALGLGPAPHPYRRIKRHGAHLRLAIKDFRVDFSVSGQSVEVLGIASGYKPSVLRDPRATARDRTPLEVHRQFVARFAPGGDAAT